MDILSKKPDRDHLITIATQMGVNLSPMLASEAIFMASKRNKNAFNFELLVDWFVAKLPEMR